MGRVAGLRRALFDFILGRLDGDWCVCVCVRLLSFCVLGLVAVNTLLGTLGDAVGDN